MSRLMAGEETGVLGPGLDEENTGGPVLRRLKREKIQFGLHTMANTDNILTSNMQLITTQN